MRGKVLDELWILDRARGMTDSIDPQCADRAPHAGGSRCFAGVRGGAESKRPCAFVGCLEQLGRKSWLEAANANADHAVVLDFTHPLEQVAGVLNPAIAYEIGNQCDLDCGDAVQSLAQRFGDPLRIELRPAVVGRREESLGIADVLPRQVARHSLADERPIVVLPQVAHHPHIRPEEAAEITVDEGAV